MVNWRLTYSAPGEIERKHKVHHFPHQFAIENEMGIGVVLVFHLNNFIQDNL